jgi:nucleoside-diphosphate-sugar epimerase
VSVRLFLAGATGAIGRRLIPLLLDAGYEVYGMTRVPEKARDLNLIGVRGVVVEGLDAAALHDAVVEVRPEIVVHQLTDLPQHNDPALRAATADRNARIRTEGTANLVNAALAASAHRIVAQSIAFAYAEGPEPHVETDPLDAKTRGSVITLERLVMQSPPLEGVVLRYGTLYGPGTWYDKPEGRCPVHIDAAARATLLAIQYPGTGIFNIAEEYGYVSSAKAHAELGWP